MSTKIAELEKEISELKQKNADLWNEKATILKNAKESHKTATNALAVVSLLFVLVYLPVMINFAYPPTWLIHATWILGIGIMFWSTSLEFGHDDQMG